MGGYGCPQCGWTQRRWIQGVLSVDGLSVGGYRVSSVDGLSVGGYRVSSGGWIQGVLSVDGLGVGGYRVSSAWVDTGCPQCGWIQGVLSVGGYRVSSAWMHRLLFMNECTH